MGQYIYSVIECSEERTFDVVPIGGAADEGPATTTSAGRRGTRDEAPIVLANASERSSIVHRRGVYTICHDGLAAVVSDSPVKEYSLTRENMLAHQRVNEFVMKDHVVLPVKFCTIADERSMIVDRLLKAKKKDLLSKLEYLKDKGEFSLKVLWKEMSEVYSSIVEENAGIKRLKEKLAKLDPMRARNGMIEIGQMVKGALEVKKEAVSGLMFERLASLAVEARKNDVYGDRMLLNAAFLVDKSKETELDVAVNALADECAGTMDWKYVGPAPAANFVEIVVSWED